jgi:MtN3 and saliva related transmembrane protein
MVNLLGFAAGTLTTLSFVPQVMKTWRTRRADDLSLGMLLLFLLGVTLWEIYGWSIGATPVILANGVTMVLALVMVVLKLRC